MERGPSKYRTSSAVKPIGWFNLLVWARRTAAQDHALYRRKNRPLSPERLFRAVVPSLRRPVFVLGAERSGTTFLGDCLAALPEISYHYEPIAVKAATRYVHDGLWTFRKTRAFYRMVYRWLMRIYLDGDLRFAEKTPRNCFIIGFLYHAFPDAQFIHIIRDGRDAALSLYQKPWLRASSAGSARRLDDGYLEGPYARFWVEKGRHSEFQTTSDLHRCIWAWRRYTESALRQAQVLPTDQYHEVRYEELVRDPAGQAARLLDYLGIQRLESRSAFGSSLARAQASSVGKWKDALTAEQSAIIEKEAGELLRRLGYV